VNGMPRPRMASNPFKRYGVYWVDLDPTRGRELKKTRPAVVVSQDALNDLLDTVVVCPLTSMLHPGWRTRLQVVLNGKPSEVAVDQIRTVSKERLIPRKVGELSARDQAALREMLNEAYAQ
jgi:mRNA interferase MazF